MTLELDHRPTPADLRSGFASRGRWRVAARSVPSFSSLLLECGRGQRARQVGPTSCPSGATWGLVSAAAALCAGVFAEPASSHFLTPLDVKRPRPPTTGRWLFAAQWPSPMHTRSWLVTPTTLQSPLTNQTPSLPRERDEHELLRSGWGISKSKANFTHQVRGKKANSLADYSHSEAPSSLA